MYCNNYDFRSPVPILYTDNEYQKQLNLLFQDKEIKNQFESEVKALFKESDLGIIPKIMAVYEEHIGTKSYFEKLDAVCQEKNGISSIAKYFFIKNIGKIHGLFLSKLDHRSSPQQAYDNVFHNEDLLIQILNYLPINNKLMGISKLFQKVALKSFKLACSTDQVIFTEFGINTTFEAINFIIKHKILHPNFIGIDSLADHHLEY